MVAFKTQAPIPESSLDKFGNVNKVYFLVYSMHIFPFKMLK